MPNYIKDLSQIFKASVNAVLPENLIKKSVYYNGLNDQLTVCGTKFNLKDKNVYLVGAGKAVQHMAIEVEAILGNKLKQGIISIPYGSVQSQKANIVQMLQGAQNNIPDEAAEANARKIIDLVVSLGEDDVLLVLLSGGGSALLPSTKEPITLKEKQALIKAITSAGADINELNTIRKRISNLKGGQLATKAQPAQVISLILSDIVGDPLDLIASGPTVENKDSPSNAIDIINKYNLRNAIPKSIYEILSKPVIHTKFPNHNVFNNLIGSNRICLEAAKKEAEKNGYTAFKLSNEVTGNVKSLAKKYVNLVLTICDCILGVKKLSDFDGHIKNINIPGLDCKWVNDIRNVKQPEKQQMCLILGGETTVIVKGNGLGGRNQQLALEFSKLINDKQTSGNLKDFDIHFLSAGTDGYDGPTDAAGAIGTSWLMEEAQKLGLNILNYLENNDSYTFYKAFRNGELHINTGHTNTNVMDLHLIIIKKH